MSDDGMWGADPQSFVVLFEGRSGSTYLIEALDSHPQVTAWKEYFATLKGKVKRGKADESVQIEWAREFLSGRDVDSLSDGTTVVGFKTKLRDVLDPPGFGDLLTRLGTRVIFQHRRNRIKLLVSLLNGQRLHQTTGDWNLYDARDRLNPFGIDPGGFAAGLDRIEKRHEELKRFIAGLALPTLSIYYEDLLTDRTRSLSRVQRFLELPERDLVGKAVKNTSDDLRDVLVNFDELRSEYLGSEYEAMFDEVLIHAGESTGS